VPHRLEVYCTVNNCRYWEQGNRCQADRILVVSDARASEGPESISSLEASTLDATPTGTCAETCCRTFAPAGAGEREEGAYRA